MGLALWNTGEAKKLTGRENKPEPTLAIEDPEMQAEEDEMIALNKKRKNQLAIPPYTGITT
jgi:hypothetical protein